MATPKEKRFYGWIALAGAMVTYFAVCGTIFYSYGVFKPIFTEMFGSDLLATAPYMMLQVLLGLAAPLVALSLAKFGPRRNIIVANILGVLGLVLMFFVTAPWHLFVFYGVLVGLGHAFVGFLPCTTVANNWFMRRRAMAMGLLLSAGGAGGFAFPPIIAGLISSIGWQLTWIVLGGIQLAAASIIGGLLIRNRPEDLGQVPDGLATKASGETKPTVTKPSRVYQTPVDWEAGQAMRTWTTWLILLMGAGVFYAVSTMIAHQVTHLQKVLYWTPVEAGIVQGLLPGMSILGRLAFGALASRFEVRHLAAACCALLLIAVVILIYSTAPAMVYLYAVIFGIGYGGLLVAAPSFIGAYYGRLHYAKILSWLMLIQAGFGVAGGLIGAAIFDATGTYTIAFIIVAAGCAIGVVCAILARPPKLPTP